MAKDKKSNILEVEHLIKQDTEKRHQKEIQLMTKMLNVFINGFNSITCFKYTGENNLEMVWLLLVTRSFHSLICALNLSLSGYYGQAISLLRTVTENVFICHDCISNPKTIDAVIYKKYNIPDSHEGLSFRQMAIRTNNKKVYDNDYAHQSEISHPTSLSIKMVVDSDNKLIIAAPVYNEFLFLDCCELFFRDAIMIGEFMGNFLSKISEDKATTWSKEVKLTYQDATDWLTKIKEKYGNESQN